MLNMAHRLLKVSEVRERLSISNATLYRRVSDDPKFPPILKIGRSSFVAEDALDRYIEGLVAEAQAA